MTESGVPLEASIRDGAVSLESILCTEELSSHRSQVLDDQRVRTTTPSAPAFDRLEVAVDHGCAEAKRVA
jgi:hypothetical protein